MENPTSGSREDKRTFWHQQLQGWEESGLSQKAYCETNSLPLANFTYWKRKLKQTDTSQPHFYPLTIPPAHQTITGQTGSGLCLLLSNERFRIEIDKDFAPATLKNLVLALEQM